MTKLAPAEQCVGCGACAAACALGCITMEEDAQGFWMPATDASRCVDCGKCAAACPVLHWPEGLSPRAAYAVCCKDDALKKKSSSGGVFSLLAQKVLAANGVVFGASMTEVLTVAHITVENEDDLSALRGSKYLQSRMETVFPEIKRLLQKERPVLFSGTPCQIAALKTFLGGEPKQLICAEVVCHGVPSQAVWRTYIDECEKCAGAKVKKVNFRDKEQGWLNSRITLEFENGESIGRPIGGDPFMRGYLANLYLRESCHTCPKTSVADLTLGDCWGAQRLAPELPSEYGISMVVVRTKKGAELLSALAGEVLTRPISHSSAERFNPMLTKSVGREPKRKKFFARRAEPFSALTEELARPSMTRKLRLQLRVLRQRMIRK